MAVTLQTRVQARAVLISLRLLQNQAPKGVDVGVAYETHCAVIVHENPRPPTSRNIHGELGQHKYLEKPARDPQVQQVMRERIEVAMVRKRGFKAALVSAAGYLLQKSDDLIPVITQTLRNSGKIVILDKGVV